MPRTVRKSLLRFSPIIALAGVCLLSTIPVVAQSSSEGLIVFYRPKRFTGSGLTPSVYLDGQQVARLDNGRFFSLKVAAGKHGITSSMKHSPLELDVKSDETIYLEMVILMGNWRGGGRFIPTPTDDALTNINKLKPLDKQWLFDQRAGFDLKMQGPQRADEGTSPPPAAGKSTLQVTSDPTGADVELDGKFVGNAPATLNLTPGDYTLTVRQKGFEAWERRVTILPDNVLRITAKLQHAP